ncbi:MAG: hypothetical protein WD016_03710 [Balneolaceae bacterium]
MNFKIRLFVPLVFLWGWMAACSISNPEIANHQNSDPEERISLEINEALQFEFQKIDSAWIGNLTVFIMNENNEKVVQSKFTSANDSSWQDFDLFVNFLKLYDIPPQNEIDGWVPDSENLPRRVYSFQVFDGESTKTFSYQDPINDLRDYWQSQNILTFVTFIENDLHWLPEDL